MSAAIIANPPRRHIRSACRFAHAGSSPGPATIFLPMRCADGAALSRAIHRVSLSHLRIVAFDSSPFAPISSRVPFAEGALARHRLSRTGCGVPRVCRCTQIPGGSGTPPSATTSGRESSHDRVPAAVLRPSRGTGAINPAVERREAIVRRRHFAVRRRARRRVRTRASASSPRTALRARVTGPRKACRCTRAPVGAPRPLGTRGQATGGEREPRRAHASRER